MIRQLSRQKFSAMFSLFPADLNHANKRPQVEFQFYFANPATGTGNGILQNILFSLQFCDLMIHPNIQCKKRVDFVIEDCLIDIF